MVDVNNRVFTNVKTHVQSEYSNASFQNSRTFTSAKFPSVCVIQIDNTEVALDLGAGSVTDDPAVRSVIEVQVISNKSITEAKEIMASACNAMRGMSYTREYGVADITDYGSVNSYRVVARFSRIVHALTDIPRFE